MKRLIALFGAVLLVVACGGDEAAETANTDKPKRVAPPAPVVEDVEAGQEEGDTEVAGWTGEGVRDPFRSFILDAKRERKAHRGPLEQFDLAQLDVVAVVWGVNNPRAVVQDPSGRGYIVKEGTLMGKNEGSVIGIDDNQLVVRETYVNYFGEESTQDVTLQVRIGKGGN